MSLRGERKWQICWCCQDQRGTSRKEHASAEKLGHTGPAEWEKVASMPQSEQLARTPEPPLTKGKSHQSKSPNREMKESLGEQKLRLGEKEAGQNECKE